MGRVTHIGILARTAITKNTDNNSKTFARTITVFIEQTLNNLLKRQLFLFRVYLR
jgi:hypothetical protein